MKKDHIWDNTYPSPENPCICLCHTEEHECWECRIGKHKPVVELKNKRE